MPFDEQAVPETSKDTLQNSLDITRFLGENASNSETEHILLKCTLAGE